ncbi:MAG: hypothetical protein CL608_04205 [Anaerolineaceae bacterium]|nr:hypothetical protein [Anaerolineaceae bacterium]
MFSLKCVRLLLVIPFLVIIAAGCQVTEPAATNLETAVSATPTIMPTNSPTPLVATATEIPPTLTATPLPTPTAVQPTPTLVPTETEPAAKIFQERESFSPDGQWRAYTLLTFVEEDGQVVGYQTELTVSELAGDISWVAYSTLQGAGMGFDVPTVVLWSEDGRSLFFTLRATPDGCGGFVGQFDSGLYRLDLASGAVERLEVSGALSPDGMTVAQLVWEPALAVALYDLASQTTTTIAWDVAWERGNGAVNLVWSPDSQAIALEYAATFCLEGGYSLIYLDLTTGEQKTLIWQEPQPMFIVAWPDAGEIHLQEPTSQGQKWSVNVNTGERTKIE